MPEQRTGGIGDRRIGDPEDASSTHLSFVKSETSDRGKDRGLVDRQVTCEKS
jgi:hypothetical protein